MTPSVENNALRCDGKFLSTSNADMVVGYWAKYPTMLQLRAALEVALFETRCIGNHGTLAATSMGGLSKWRDMSELVEVDDVDGSVVSMVELYWLH